MANSTFSVNGGAMREIGPNSGAKRDRSQFVGGSDARIIMGQDEKALHRLWQEKRGEAAPIDLSDVLIVQLGLATEDLNRRWYEQNSGHRISDIQRRAIHRTIPWMAATLDGLVKETGAVFEAKFMLPWSFSEEAAAGKHMAQLQHNMLVAGVRKSVLSIINGGGKWVELTIEADPIYQTILIAAEKAFWRAVKTGETPALFDCEPPKPRIHPPGSCRPRAGQGRAQRADARGCQGGDGSRHPGETLKIGRRQLRSGRDGGFPCIAPVKVSPPLRPRWRKPRPNSPIPRR